jgi:hypothetical protein
MPHLAIGRETQAGLQLQGSKGPEVLVHFWDTSLTFDKRVAYLEKKIAQLKADFAGRKHLLDTPESEAKDKSAT